MFWSYTKGRWLTGWTTDARDGAARVQKKRKMKGIIATLNKVQNWQSWNCSQKNKCTKTKDSGNTSRCYICEELNIRPERTRTSTCSETIIKSAGITPSSRWDLICSENPSLLTKPDFVFPVTQLFEEPFFQNKDYISIFIAALQGSVIQSVSQTILGFHGKDKYTGAI